MQPDHPRRHRDHDEVDRRGTTAARTAASRPVAGTRGAGSCSPHSVRAGRRADVEQVHRDARSSPRPRRTRATGAAAGRSRLRTNAPVGLAASTRGVVATPGSRTRRRRRRSASPAAPTSRARATTSRRSRSSCGARRRPTRRSRSTSARRRPRRCSPPAGSRRPGRAIGGRRLDHRVDGGWRSRAASSPHGDPGQGAAASGTGRMGAWVRRGGSCSGSRWCVLGLFATVAGAGARRARRGRRLGRHLADASSSRRATRSRCRSSTSRRCPTGSTCVLDVALEPGDRADVHRRSARRRPWTRTCATCRST